MKLLLKNSSNLGDIVITDGIITSIGKPTDTCDDEINCTNKIIWPGLIDSHVHFRTPGQEYKEDWKTGSAAALAGGVTTVIDMPNNKIPITSEKLLEEKNNLIKPVATIDYRLNIGVTDETIDEVIAASSKSNAIKIFLGSSTGNMVLEQEDNIRKLFSETNSLLMIHSEDEATINNNEQIYKENEDAKIHSLIRSKEAAIIATEKAIALAEEFNKTIYLCHITSQEEIELIKEAKAKGVKVYAEVTPHHLFLNDEMYENHKNFVKVNPPLRTKADNDALWKAIKDKTIDVIATDHAPHTIEEKKQPYWDAPAGIPSIQFMFPLLLTAMNNNKLSLDDIKHCCIENPAKIFKINKTITVNKPADLVIFDPMEEWIIKKHDILSKCGWSPYEGYRLQGKIFKTIKTINN